MTAVLVLVLLATACSDTSEDGGAPAISTEESGTTAAEATLPSAPVIGPPYEEREVRFDHPSGAFGLAGTLAVPIGDGPFPGVVLISGSGSQDRNETIGSNEPFLVLADGLARQGIAVLRFDDRGVGDSGGEPVEVSGATTVELAEDATAAVDFLARQAEVARGRIGVVGHSEGGLIGPIVANSSETVGFAVLLAGSGIPGADLLEIQTGDILRAEGASSEWVDWEIELTRELIDIALSDASDADAGQAIRQIAEDAGATAPLGVEPGYAARKVEAFVGGFLTWLRFFLAYDPAPALTELQIPVLAVFGGLDAQVSAEVNAPAIQAALAGNADAMVITLPGLNHLFQPAKTGALSEYFTLDETFADEAIDLIATWIVSTP